MTIGFVVFFRGDAASPIEGRLQAIQLAIATHVASLAGAAGFQPVLAVTPDPDAERALAAAGAQVTRPSVGPFHLGRELREVVRTFDLSAVCTVGAGAGALLLPPDLVALHARLASTEAVVLSNNYYSGDIVGFAPASALTAIDLPATDNPLPRLLHQQAGLPSVELPRRAATLFDVDTPTDATILLRHPRCPPSLRALGAWEAEQGERISSLLRLLVTPDVEVCIAGRVGASVWAYLETQSACRVRVLSEERGMQAAGRDASGEARSVLGYVYELLGPRDFFARLAELGQGIIFDSRVLLAHLGVHAGPADRFASDIFAHREIADERLAAFTRAAAEAPVPVLLGGHSVVSGGLWAMAEAAWEPA